MSKKLFILTAIALLIGSICVYAQGPADLQPVDMNDPNAESSHSSSAKLDKNTDYYPNGTLGSAINKYKAANYTGCLQELFSIIKRDPSNVVAYYYMALAYSHVDMTDDAVEAYEKVIALDPNSYIAEIATKGRDCISGGPACHPENENSENQDELDQFINSPYGNGLSPEINAQMKKQELDSIYNTINDKKNLDSDDIQKIRNFDNKKDPTKSQAEETDKIAMVSDEEVLNAIQTLKKAGVNVTYQKNNNPYAQMAEYQDPEMAQLSMMLGNNNNNNNNMMNMIPMLMAQHQEGKNIDPRFMQAMIMNSMMPDFSFNDNNNNR